jgi:periplasmic divalent cation tolerance protein
MAAEARRTPAKVKSSAMTPRQPEVPKWIVCFVTGDYCILAHELKSRKNGASRKSKGGWATIMTDKIIVLVTCGSRKETRKIACALVGQRLAACVSEIAVPVASTYRWKGKVESAKEFLLLIKTSRRRFAAVRDAVRKLHSYEVPEIIALPIAVGSRAYLDWIAASVKRA